MTFRLWSVTTAHGLLLLCLCAVSVAAQERHPVPSASAQQEALKLVKEVYSDKLVPGQERAVAELMIQDAQNVASVTDGYVMLRVARDIAMGAGDATVAMEAIDDMDRRYVIDAFQMKTAVLLKTAESAKSESQLAAIAECSAPLIGHAVTLNQFDLAQRLCAMAVAAARKARQWEAAKELVTRQAEIDGLSQEYARLTDALKRLDENPVDPEANLEVGKYHCFRKGDWEKGLHMLALGSDPKLKQLATGELKGIASPSEQMAQADGWWEIAEHESEPARSNFLTRAYSWYQAAAPQLDGLLRQRAEKRIASIEESVPDFKDRQPPLPPSVPQSGGHAPDTVNQTIDLGLKWLVDHQGNDGGWTFATGPNGGSLKDCTETATAMALIPLLRAGHTHQAGQHKGNVDKGLRYLMGRMKVDKNKGSFHREGSTMYGHGICAIALGEAYARSKDRSLRVPAQAAVNYIMYAQDPKGGGWRYKPQQPGDTSVLGWQMQALVISDRAGIQVAPLSYAGASAFLNGVQLGEGVFYGYTQPGEGSSTTAIGLWSRLHLGWKPTDPRIQKGVTFFVESGPSATNYYSNYYVSCLLKACEPGVGKGWADPMRDHFLGVQSKEGDTAGSWFAVGNHGTERGGRLYCTTMALMTLLNL